MISISRLRILHHKGHVYQNPLKGALRPCTECQLKPSAAEAYHLVPQLQLGAVDMLQGVNTIMKY